MDLTICQDCKENPSVYGDGLTWGRCSGCQLKLTKNTIPTEPEPVPIGEGFEHKVVEGLTSIILPVYMNNYSLFHYTGNCIGSIREHTDSEITPYELVVVDNGSPTKPPELTSYYAHRVIVNAENLGVTKAWNQAIRASIGEYIVLINNDVQVFDNWLGNLRSGLFDGYDLVMAHPMYSLTEPFARAVEASKIEKKVYETGKLYSDFKDFSCVMFKRSLLNEIGMFDEQFFNYCSDSDFFRRLELAGKKWACAEFVPTSHISDATGYSISETPEIMNKDKETYKEKWESVEILNSEIPIHELTYTHVNLGGRIVEGLVRVEKGGDPIYLLLNQKFHHIKDLETLHALGGQLGSEVVIPNLEGFEKGAEINMSNYQKYV
jgi:glycosyltransferase involved in cell wall biosynthesis